MRLKLFTSLAIAMVFIGAGASAASASQPSAVVAQWKKADAAFFPAQSKWSAMLAQSKAPTVARLQKANTTYAPAVKRFDSSLEKIGFTGKAKSDISSLVKLNGRLITVLDHTTSIKSFENGYGPLFPKYAALQTALGKDLGIRAAEIYI